MNIFLKYGTITCTEIIQWDNKTTFGNKGRSINISLTHALDMLISYYYG